MSVWGSRTLPGCSSGPQSTKVQPEFKSTATLISSISLFTSCFPHPLSVFSSTPATRRSLTHSLLSDVSFSFCSSSQTKPTKRPRPMSFTSTTRRFVCVFIKSLSMGSDSWSGTCVSVQILLIGNNQKTLQGGYSFRDYLIVCDTIIAV